MNDASSLSLHDPRFNSGVEINIKCFRETPPTSIPYKLVATELYEKEVIEYLNAMFKSKAEPEQFKLTVNYLKGHGAHQKSYHVLESVTEVTIFAGSLNEVNTMLPVGGFRKLKDGVKPLRSNRRIQSFCLDRLPVSYEQAKEYYQEKDNCVFELVDTAGHGKLYGEWSFDFLEALIIMLFHDVAKELSEKEGKVFCVMPKPANTVIPHLQASKDGTTVSEGKGGRVWVNDDDHIWSIADLASLHQHIIACIGCEAQGVYISLYEEEFKETN